MALFCFGFDRVFVKTNLTDYLYENNKGVPPDNHKDAHLTEARKTSNLNHYLSEQGPGLKNPEQLLEAIRNLWSLGHHVAILADTKFPSVINPVLKKLGLTEDEIGKIYIENANSKTSDRKNKQIQRAMRKFEIDDRREAVIIDGFWQVVEKAKLVGHFGILIHLNNDGYLRLINIFGVDKADSHKRDRKNVADVYKHNALLRRSTELEEKKTKLDTRESELTEKFNQLMTLSSELEAKMQDIAQREQALNDREQRVCTRELLVKEREDSLECSYRSPSISPPLSDYSFSLFSRPNPLIRPASVTPIEQYDGYQNGKSSGVGYR